MNPHEKNEKRPPEVSIWKSRQGLARAPGIGRGVRWAIYILVALLAVILILFGRDLRNAATNAAAVPPAAAAK
jgi:hypothetical protein